MGGFGPVAWKRATRVGDGVILGWGVEMCAPAIEAIRGFFAADGREVGTFGFEMQLQYSSDRWGDELAGWRDAGGTHVSLTTMQCGLDKPVDHIEAIRRFKRAADAG